MKEIQEWNPSLRSLTELSQEDRESKQTIDRAVEIFSKVKQEAYEQPELVLTAPHTLPVKRVDELKAAKELDIFYQA